MHVDSTHIIKDNLKAKVQHRKHDFLFFGNLHSVRMGALSQIFQRRCPENTNENAAESPLIPRFYRDSCPA